MFCIVRSCKIISPSMECKHDNVMYMLCTLVEQCQMVGKGLYQVVKCLNICHLILIKSYSLNLFLIFGLSTNGNLVIFMFIFWVAY
jgi:hypothetical protein